VRPWNTDVPQPAAAIRVKEHSAFAPAGTRRPLGSEWRDHAEGEAAPAPDSDDAQWPWHPAGSALV